MREPGRKRHFGFSCNPFSLAPTFDLLSSDGSDDIGETVEKHGFHSRPQVVRALAVAPDGLVWAEVATVDGGPRILLVAPEGRIEGVLPEGWPMPLSFLPDGRPLVQVVDSLDLERIGIGRIVK